MGGPHCLICYTFIPNSNTFNSSKNQDIYVSLCKLLQLPVEPFKDILSGSPTCPECVKDLEEGAQVIKRFEVLRREINQLRAAFENKIVTSQKLSLDLNDLEDGHKERRSVIKELIKLDNSSEGEPRVEFKENDLDHDIPSGELEDNELAAVQMSSEELTSHPKPRNSIIQKGLRISSFTINKRCSFCPKSNKKWTIKTCSICERSMCKLHREDQRFCTNCSSKFGQFPFSLPFKLPKEANQMRVNKMEDYKERTLIIKKLKPGGDEADTLEEFEADYSPFAQVNSDSPESPYFAESDPNHQEEIHMSRRDISSLPEIKLFEYEGLTAPESQNMALEEVHSTLSDPMNMPGGSGIKKPRSNRNKLVKPPPNQSNCITLKVPILQLVKLPLPLGQTAFKLEDLSSIGVNPLQNLPNPTSNLPERISFKHKFACTLCSKVCISPDTFYVHSNYFNHTLKSFQCCSEQFPTIVRLNKHRRLVHDEAIRKLNVIQKRKRLYQCDECGLRCNGRGTLQDHINAVHLDLRFSCTWPGCTESFKTKSSLKYHVYELHKNYTPFLCEKCPKSFVTQGKLNQHLNTVHYKDLFRIKGAFKCDKCPSILPYEKALVRHVKRVHNPVRHLCTICGYELKTKLYLSDHMKLHEKKGDKFRPRNRSCWKRNQQEVGTMKN